VRFDLWIGHPAYEAKMKPAITKAVSEGYAVWLTIMHRDRSNVADQARFDRSQRGGFPPQDPARYQELVRRTIHPLVESLRSQGKAPGEWFVVQIENEILPDDVMPTNPNRFWQGSSKEFLNTLQLAYDAVKSVDPSIPVAVGGIASEGLEIVLRGPSPGARWIDRLLREGRFDVVDAHLYHAIESIPRKLAWVRARWNGPIAATEIGGPDERAGVQYSEAHHAEDLPRRFRAVREAGADLIFWLTMADAPTADRLGQTMGLTREDGSRKSAYEAYRQLIQRDTSP
jgi:hypothetical protein